MSDLVVLDPERGDEMFRARHGERRIPWEALVALDSFEVAAFQAAITAYMDAHPRLEVVVIDHKAADEMVVRWRWRSGA